MGRYSGRVVFVQGGLPGEIVSVRLTQTSKSYARGVVEQVLSPAPERVTPPCPLFGRCGGCQWQYIAYPTQLALKRTIVQEQCQRLGEMESPPVAPTIGMNKPWACRSTTTLHLTPEGQLGYYAWHSHDIVPIEQCPLLAPAIDALLAPLANALQEIPPADRPSQVTLRYSWAEQSCLILLQRGPRPGAISLRDRLSNLAPEIAWQHHRKTHILSGRGFLLEALGHASLRVSPTSFFQVNIPQTRRLLDVVTRMLDAGPEDLLLDAYAGVGALSLPLASRVKHLTAIESHPAALADLRENAHRLGIEQVELIQGLVEKELPSLKRPFDLVLLDPPRRGCHPEALQAVLRSRPRRIVYVSCHPGTLARDLRRLCQEYHLAQIQPVDLFPQTFHIESVALLERGS